MTEAKNSDYFGKSPFDDLQNVTNTVMDVIKQDRDRKLAIAQATADVSAKQQEDLKNQQSEDAADDMKATREKEEAKKKRKREAMDKENAWRRAQRANRKASGIFRQD